MERCIFYVYKYSRLESARQSMKPYAKMFVYFCNFRGENALKKCSSAFRIRTNVAYVSLGLINCVLISLAFILLQSNLFVGYSVDGLDGEIF